MPRKTKQNKTKNCFTGGRTCQVGSVGRAGVFILFYFFFISGSKNYPKNTKLSKKKKIYVFLQKNFKKIFWLIFKKFQLKFLDFGFG